MLREMHTPPASSRLDASRFPACLAPAFFVSTRHADLGCDCRVRGYRRDYRVFAGSSTGHLLIAERWLPHQSDLFNIVIQCGAVLAVLPLFPERLRQFAFGWRERATRDYAAKLLLAFVLTGSAG